MPRYYFDVTDNGEGMPDQDGSELDSLEDAREEALATLGQIVKDRLPDGDHRKFVITIKDQLGDRVLTASLMLSVERWPANSP